MKLDIQKELRKYASAERKTTSEYFFKTGDGCYAEWDKFIGVSMPNIRKVAKIFNDIKLVDIKSLLKSEIHEDRLCVLVILSERSKKGDREEREKNARFYLKHKKHVNNWDLVDVSAHYILGQYILDNADKRDILDELVVSKNLWDRRIAIVSTWIMIRHNRIDEILYLAEKVLSDKEDLIHKATGWMLREAWKKQPKRVEDFLKKNYQNIPRTVLRYTIERMEEDKRKYFLNMKK